MDPDGSNPTRLTDNSAVDVNPVCSPDGTKIVFNSNRDGDFDIFIMDADGSNQTRLTNNTTSDFSFGGTWSPDGRRLFYVSDIGEPDPERRSGDYGNMEIYMLDADGSNQTRLTNTAVNEWGPDLSPDGRKITFTRRTTTAGGLGSDGNSGHQTFQAASNPA